MKKVNIVIVIVASLALSYLILAHADSTDRSLEYILNRVFDSSTNTLRIE